MTLKHAILSTVILAAPVAPALAQTPAPKPDVPAPHADPGIVAAPNAGIIPAPKTDPGMTVPPPQSGKGTVISPPGTPSNTPSVVPK